MELDSSALAEKAFERCQRRFGPQLRKQCILGSQIVGLYGIAEKNTAVEVCVPSLASTCQ